MYEITTIGNVGPVRRAPIMIGAVDDVQAYVSKPALVVGGVGLLLGLVLGAAIFGGRRG